MKPSADSLVVLFRERNPLIEIDCKGLLGFKFCFPCCGRAHVLPWMDSYPGFGIQSIDRPVFTYENGWHAQRLGDGRGVFEIGALFSGCQSDVDVVVA
jgi:hypothetical protein